MLQAGNKEEGVENSKIYETHVESAGRLWTYVSVGGIGKRKTIQQQTGEIVGVGQNKQGTHYQGLFRIHCVASQLTSCQLPSCFLY